ncbi:MAG: hypothetical protein ACLVGQ_11065 [Blautia massiliensis (ex Durand et al. 2017)]|uniref:hypothetical protein n=1 Tax=Blautia massiliensis (ex Durand et al. 2017) TaxID=1737424 RepID=UPI00399C7214
MFEDGKVTVAYMKSFEIEQMWINKGIEQGSVKESPKGLNRELAKELAKESARESLKGLNRGGVKRG